MTLLSHFPSVGISNTYVVGPDSGGDALLVDPGRFDVELLELIEGHDLNIKAVLVTHAHENHVQGLRTLKKIYDVEVYAGYNRVFGFPATTVSHGSLFRAAGYEIGVMEVVGHSADSRVYLLDHYMFTGDILSAGRVGTTRTLQARDLMIESIRTTIMGLDRDLILLPGHGPPTTLNAERLWNPELSESRPPDMVRD